MEDYSPKQTITGCKRCGDSDILPDSPTPLCSDCRSWYIKFPIPLWLKYFAGGIGIILTLALTKLPLILSPAIHLGRGIKAENEKKYITARNEFQEASLSVNDYTKANAHLLIAAFYNQDWNMFSTYYKEIQDKDIDDEELLRNVNNVIVWSDNYSPSDNFSALENKFKDNGYNIPVDSLKNYTERNETDLYGLYQYACELFDEDKFESADTVLKQILYLDKNYFPALKTESILNRSTGDFEKSLEYCKRMLAINEESSFALSSEARTMLKFKKDKEALALAMKAYDIDPNGNYSFVTLVIALHFNNDIKQRDEMISSAKALNDSGLNEGMKLVADIISNKFEFRK